MRRPAPTRRPWLALPLLSMALAGCPEVTPQSDGGGFIGPALAIVSFTATPTTIAAGETVTLAWESTGASGCNIEPGLGVVPRLGTATLSPAVSTSYTLTCSGGGEEVFEGVFVSVTGDAGPTPLDAGPLDAGPLDAGPLDAGPLDAGPTVIALTGAHEVPLPMDLTVISDDLLLQVFRERENFTLPVDLLCDAHVATSYVDDTYLRGASVPAGTRVDVFFLRASSAGNDVFDAELTFGREVLCLIPTDTGLNASQPVLAAPGTTYASLDPDGGSNDGTGVQNASGDTLFLSADRRTVGVHFVTSLGNLSHDDTRVVVAAAGQGPVEIRDPALTRAAAPNGDLSMGMLELDALQLIDEQAGVTLTAPVLVDATGPGTYQGEMDGGPQAMLAAGTYDVVVIHHDRADPTDTSSTERGTVTFDRVVRGIALSSASHEATATVMSSPLLWEGDNTLEAGDTVQLFDDGRSLYLDITVYGTGVDTVRLFLDAAP